MSKPGLPLLKLFTRLRGLGLPLGVAEYVAALRAVLEVGVASRGELTWVCQCLWAHSLEEQQQVALAVEATLPARLTEADLERMHQPPEPGDTSSTGGPSSPAQGKGQTRAEGGETSGDFPVAVGGAAEGKSVVMPRPALHEGERSRSFDLAGVPRVPPRAMHRAWRRLRNMQRTGPATDLDVSATALQLARNGVLTAPVLLPRRCNRSGVVVLLDEGGSMVPFRRLVSALLHAVRHSGLARADVFSFHDVPGETLFREGGWSGPVALDAVLQGLGDSGLLVVSDAGAARGRFDQARLDQTTAFLDWARSCAARLAWLNPVPRLRWLRTTAGAIARLGVPMKPLDREGMESAIEVLRGRGP